MKFLAVLLSAFFLVSCGTESESNLDGSKTGLVGKYQDGGISNANYFAYVNDGIGAKLGVFKAFDLVKRKKTLIPDKGHKITLKDGQMLSAGYYHTDNFYKHLELWWDGDTLVGDRLAWSYGKEIDGAWVTAKKGQEIQIFGVFGGAHKLFVKNLGKNKLQIKVKK